MAQAQRSTDDSEGFDAGEEKYLELRTALHEFVEEFAEQNDVGPGVLSLLLVDLGVTMSMLDYVVTIEKPSSMGLKLQLDRFRREIDDFIRSSKKIADEFVSNAKDLVSAIEAETTSSPGAS
jgi:hypothetical protein